MRGVLTVFATIVAVSGLVLAGSEGPEGLAQVIVCTVGVGMFAGGMYWISRIHG